ncbi:MAG TPA: SEFIR domain-containing protein [Pseudonocardiaceae bacterium]
MARRVFISYAQESEAHRTVVRDLWAFLRTNGIDAIFDQVAAGERQDWALWMADQIRAADVVLCVASEQYRIRAQGQAGPRNGKGVQWEARLIRDAFHAAQDDLQKFVPVVVPGQSIDGVPDFLAPSTTTVYVVDDFTLAGAEKLLRFLLRKPELTELPLGHEPEFGTWRPGPSTAGAPGRGAGADPGPATGGTGGTAAAGGRRDLTADYAPVPPVRDRLVSPQVGGMAAVIGRDQELADLRAAFTARPTNRAPVVRVLVGMGGVGKTSLARAYAQRHLDDYGVVWWVRAEDPTAVDGEYRGLLELVHSAAEANMVRDAVQLANAWLSERKQPWLLVLDNVPDAAALHGLFPARGIGDVLVTSQASRWPDPGMVHHVGPLDTDAAVELLTTVSQDADTETAVELAGELDGLPLALTQAASFTTANGVDLATYLRFYRDRSGDLYADGRPDDYPHTVATTWLLAIGQLAGPARKILDTIACFAPDSVPTSVLQPLVDDEFTLTKAVGELLAHSLVTRGAPGAITVHRLVQAVTRHRLGDLPGHARRARDLIAAALPERPLTAETMEVWNRLRSHALAVVDHVPTDPLTFDLRYEMAFLHGEMGDVRAASAHLKDLVDDMSPVLGPEDGRVLRARHGVTFWLDKYDMPQARALLADLLGTQTRVLGAEHPDTLVTRHDLAYACWHLNEAGRAKQMFEELLPVRAEVLGPNHRYTMMTRSFLINLRAVHGGLEEAIGDYRELIADSTAALGALHLDTIEYQAGYADLLGRAGDAAAARDLYAWVVDQLTAQQGPYHKLTLEAHLPLAVWTAAAGNPQRAVHTLIRMLTRFRTSLGKNNPMVRKIEDGLDSIKSGPPKGGGGKQVRKKRKR